MLWGAAIVALVALGSFLIVRSEGIVSGGAGGDGSGSDGFPPIQTAATPLVDPASFVGSEACADCHDEAFEDWSGSTHGHAGGDPDAEVVIAPFDGLPVRFADATVFPTQGADGRFFFVVLWGTEAADTLMVDGVVGGGHMEGGGTQGFFTSREDGTLRFLPFDWSRHERRWFCNTRAPNPGEWLPITESLRLAQCADWPPFRVLGPLTGFVSCGQCHGSQIQASFDSQTRRFKTSFATLRINCESCHGPGARHVEMANAGTIVGAADIGYTALDTAEKDASIRVCLRCHASKVAIQPGDLPGAPLEENYSLLLPQLTDRIYQPDNRIRTFGYQANHLSSVCYLFGSMTCTDCHAPHTQTYRDVNWAPLVGRFDDGQCTSCHPSKLENVEAHTGHAPESTGSQCVACHMPFLQHPGVGTSIQYGRSDHTIPVPRPAADEALGIPNACSLCHAELSPSAAQALVDDWYGTLKPREPLIQGIIDSRAGVGPDRAAALLLRPDQTFPMAQFQALGAFMIQFLAPDSPGGVPGGAEPALRTLALSPDLDVAALALAALHLSGGTKEDTRTFLRERVSELGDRERPVRLRWVMILSYMGDVFRFRGRSDLAAVIYRKALELEPTDAQILEKSGLALLEVGDADGAVDALSASVRADDSRAVAFTNLGNALEQQGESELGLQALVRATERNPWAAPSMESLGNAYLRRRDFQSAGSAYARALSLDASLVASRIGIAQIQIVAGDLEGARVHLLKAMEFQPENPQVRRLLEQLGG